MSAIVYDEFMLEDGSLINVEVIESINHSESENTIPTRSFDGNEETDIPRSIDADGVNDTAYKQARSIDRMITAIQPITNKVVKTLNSINSPDEIELELGIKFSAKAGIILASVDNECIFKVKMNWKKNSQAIKNKQDS